jgi:hypothetical protein
MNWLWVIIIVAIIGGIIGFLGSDDKERLPGCLGGMVMGGGGCAWVIAQVVIAIGSLILLFKIASWLFS